MVQWFNGSMVQIVQWFKKFNGSKSSKFSFADFCHDSAIRKQAFMALAAPKVQSIFYSSFVIRH